MRLLVRYFRPMVYGNYTTLTFEDIDPEKTFVSQLKRKIFIKMRVEPKFQKLTIRAAGQQNIELKNENSLSTYNITENATIILENLSMTANKEHQHNENFECNTEEVHEQVCKLISHHGKNPKYLQKLGIIQQQINQVSNTQRDHEQAIIDGLCDAIRSGQTVPDFIQLLKRLYKDELLHMHRQATSSREEMKQEEHDDSRVMTVALSKEDAQKLYEDMGDKGGLERHEQNRLSILDASIDVGILNAGMPSPLDLSNRQLSQQSTNAHTQMGARNPEDILQQRGSLTSQMGLKGASTSDLDLNLVGSSGFNCLHAACGSGNIEMTDYLLFKRNVNPNTPGKDGWTPLEIAVQAGIVENVRTLLSDDRLNLKTALTSRGSPLHISASAGNLKITNMLLLEAPYLLMTKDGQSKTPLEVATSPKVIRIISRYLDSYKGDQVTYDIDSDAPATNTIDNLNTGGLDQIVENEEEEDEENAASYAQSLALKNNLMKQMSAKFSSLKANSCSCEPGSLSCTCGSNDPGSPIRKTSFEDQTSTEESKELQSVAITKQQNRTSRFGNVMNSILSSSRRDTQGLSRDVSPSNSLIQERQTQAQPILPQFGMSTDLVAMSTDTCAIFESLDKRQDDNSEQESEESAEEQEIVKQEQVTYTDYSLVEILDQNLRNLADIKRIQEMLTSRSKGKYTENVYQAFYPLIRLKGHLSKMHVTKLTKYLRFVYLNPIEGVLISYKTANKFPHQPHNIIPLNQITILEFMRETKWYFSRGHYYMKVATPDKTQIFFDDNLDVVNFWVSQINLARKFYVWLQDLIKIRYKIQQANCINNCANANCKCSIDLADNLINTVMKLQLPEVDMDQYTARLQISANDFAIKKATEFIYQNREQMHRVRQEEEKVTTSSSSNKRSGVFSGTQLSGGTGAGTASPQTSMTAGQSGAGGGMWSSTGGATGANQSTITCEWLVIGY